MLVLPACGEAEQTAPPLADSVKVVYDTVPVERGDVTATLVYSSYVVPVQVDAAFDEVSGTVAEVFVKPGDMVEQGDPLLVLDTEALSERLAAARESLAELEDTGARERRLLEIDFELAKLDYEEAAEADPASVTAALAELEVRRRQASLDSYDEQFSRSLASARESVDTLQTELDDSTLRAPVSGEVLSVYTSAGSQAASSTTLVSISDGDDRCLVCDSSERFPAGATFSMVADGTEYALVRWEYTDREAAAFDAAGENAPPRFVRADGGELPAFGEFVQLRVVREHSPNTLRIPANALWRDSGLTYVYTVENGEKVYTEVETGAESDAYIEILSGLEEGDEVYVGK